MVRSTVPGSFPTRISLVLFSAFVLTCMLFTPVAANVAPEAVIYFNVMPAEDPQSYCTTDITDCSQMHSSTDAMGLVEFQIFIYPWSHLGESVTGLTADLNWPDEWQIMDFAVCRDGTANLECWGSSPHAMQLDWSCGPVYEMFLAATLVFDVEEYGQLSFGESSVWIGCPPDGYAVLPTTSVWGEAGTGCEYTQQPCVDTHGFRCIPRLHIDEMTLVAKPGEVAHGETHFGGSQWFESGCHGHFSVTTGDAWCTGYVVDGVDLYDNILMIDADPAGLDPGAYQTWVQVHGSGSARCLDLNLTVEGTSGVETPEGPTVTRLTWGKLRALYR